MLAQIRNLLAEHLVCIPTAASISDTMAAHAMTPEEVAEELNAPFSSGVRMKEITFTELMNIVVQGGSFKTMFNHPRFPQMQEHLYAQDRAKLANWAVAFALDGAITVAERDAIVAMLTATIADERSKAERAGIVVNVENIKRAMMED